MEIKRILLAAPKSGSGKTVVTCGLLAALRARGLKLAAFKCGPDYIDPMFHRRVLGVESENLDSFFLDDAGIKELFVRRAAGKELSLIEGVMGYFDGLGGASLRASAWDVGRITQTPVILVVDARGASLSLAAQVKGFLDFVPDGRIQGVIFNRMNPMMGRRMAPELEKLGVRLLGCVPEEDVFRLESRHLGLSFPDGEGEEKLRAQIAAMGRRLEDTLDMDGILELAASAPELTEAPEFASAAELSLENPCTCGEMPAAAGIPGRACAASSSTAPVTIGIARDDAFCFYYEENLRLLEALGARLVPFSPLKDRELPPGIDGLLLGGGYPELWAKELAENVSMRDSIRSAVRSGMPSLAECGGFLYLHRHLEGQDGGSYPMAGVLPFDAFRQKRLSRFGYIELETEDGERLRGHEFHYWESEAPGQAWTARKPESDRSWKCVHGENGSYWGFPHLYYPSNPAWLERWLDRCLAYRARRESAADEALMGTSFQKKPKSNC